jgi:hypothetical protein
MVPHEMQLVCLLNLNASNSTVYCSSPSSTSLAPNPKPVHPLSDCAADTRIPQRHGNLSA